MPHARSSFQANTLLAALSDADMALIEPLLTRVKIEREQTLVAVDEPIEHVYFPEGGICSIVSYTSDRAATEVGIFGREGVSAPGLLLGADRSPHHTFVQIGDATAWRADADRLLAAYDRSASLRRTLLRYVQTLLVQTAQSAVANAQHRIESRLARWLLMCHDRLDGDEVSLTHEFMGMMIGAQRSGVTVSLHILEGAGMIRSTRGRVTILSREKLKELADSSYGQPEAEYRCLLGSLGKG